MGPARIQTQREIQLPNKAGSMQFYSKLIIVYLLSVTILLSASSNVVAKNSDLTKNGRSSATYNARQLGGLINAIKQIKNINAAIEIDDIQKIQSVTIPENVNLVFKSNGRIDVAAGNSMTINSKLDQTSQQMFSSNSKVIFGNNSNKEIMPQWWGAKGDGKNDDTAALKSAVDAASNRILLLQLTGSSYRVTDTIIVDKPINIRSNSSVLMDIAPNHKTGKLISITSDNVIVEGLVINGNSSTKTNGSRYGIFVNGSNRKKIRNVVIKNCTFRDMLSAETGKRFASHAIYNIFADGTIIDNNSFDNISGAAVFITDSDGTKISDNKINNTGWYSIQYKQNCHNSIVTRNRITGDKEGIRMWGGSINLMSNGKNEDNPRISNIMISGNYISGVHSYGAVIHIESASNITFKDNIVENISNNDKSAPFISYIRIYTRGLPRPNKGPSKDIFIDSNIMTAGNSTAIGVYADNNDYGDKEGVDYAERLKITNNRIVSTDKTHFFSHGILVNGNSGGWKDIEISNNTIQGIPSNIPFEGLIGIAAKSSRPVSKVRIYKNSIDGIDSRQSAYPAISIGANCEDAQITGNVINKYNSGIKTSKTTRNISINDNIHNK